MGHGKTIYHPLIDGEVGLKCRRYARGRKEMSVNADLYCKDVPVSPFIIIVHEGPDRFTDIYLVKDFGEIDELGNDIPGNLIEQHQKLLKYIGMKSYKLNEHTGNKIFGISNQQLVIHDLDCGLGTMDNASDIVNGVVYGKGKFVRLYEILQKLRQPDMRIDVSV